MFIHTFNAFREKLSIVMRVKAMALNLLVPSKPWTANVDISPHCCSANWKKKSDSTRCRCRLHRTYQDATAAHGRFSSQQVLPDKVDQRGGGDLKAVRIGPIGKWREGLSWFQGQDLRQRNLLSGREKKQKPSGTVSILPHVNCDTAENDLCT